MLRLLLRVILMAMLSALVAACATRRANVDDARMFEIRDVGVTGNEGVPGGVLNGVRRQMELAIEATDYAVPKVRAVMNIHIVSVERDGAGRAQAEISVTVSDVASVQPVLVRNYLVLAFSERPRVSSAVIADAIASRLRFEFGLSMPPIRPVLQHDPALSTKLRTGIDVGTDPVQPIVVPLKTAPVVGADQDPLLNSRTKVAPIEEPARIEPAIKAKKTVPAENTLESGAKAKVTIKPATEAPDDEPCVETLEQKC